MLLFKEFTSITFSKTQLSVRVKNTPVPTRYEKKAFDDANLCLAVDQDYESNFVIDFV